MSSPREYDHKVIVDQDTYRAAWRARAGPQGGEPPPHGYLDHNRRAIVVYRPPAEAQVVRTAPLHLPHETDRPKVRGGLFDWLWRRWRLPKPQLGEQLSSGGDAGKLAYSRPGEIGVFEAILPDGRTVAVKIYPDEGGSGDANQRERFARELAGAEAASRARAGPKFYGEVNVGRRRLGYAMERIEGDFAEAQHQDGASADGQRADCRATGSGANHRRHAPGRPTVRQRAAGPGVFLRWRDPGSDRLQRSLPSDRFREGKTAVQRSPNTSGADAEPSGANKQRDRGSAIAA